MEKKYGGKHFNKIVAQNDIMVFVGNGFDIKILKKLNKKILPLYQKFFDFLEYAECNKENKLFLKMKQDKGNTENWCDFENALYELIPTGDLDELNEHLFELQTLFSMFLSSQSLYLNSHFTCQGFDRVVLSTSTNKTYHFNHIIFFYLNRFVIFLWNNLTVDFNRNFVLLKILFCDKIFQ